MSAGNRAIDIIMQAAEQDDLERKPLYQIAVRIVRFRNECKAVNVMTSEFVRQGRSLIAIEDDLRRLRGEPNLCTLDPNYGCR